MSGKYSKVQTLIFSAEISSSSFSNDEQILLIGLRSGVLKVFHKNLMYEESQSLNVSSSPLQTLSITNGREMIATGARDRVARIYKKTDQEYELNQSI